jgi:hypothetical protein
MKERIDNWHKIRAPAALTIQANILSISPSLPTTLAITGNATAISIPLSIANTSQDEEELTTLEVVTVAALKHQNAICKCIGSGGNAKTTPKTINLAIPSQNPPIPSPNSNSFQPIVHPNSSSMEPPKTFPNMQQSQYHYSSAIKDPRVV